MRMSLKTRVEGCYLSQGYNTGQESRSVQYGVTKIRACRVARGREINCKRSTEYIAFCFLLGRHGNGPAMSDDHSGSESLAEAEESRFYHPAQTQFAVYLRLEKWGFDMSKDV